MFSHSHSGRFEQSDSFLILLHTDTGSITAISGVFVILSDE